MEISSRKSLSRRMFAIGLVVAVSGIGGSAAAAEETGHYAVTAMQARERAAAEQQQEEKIREIFSEQDKQLESAREFRSKAEYESAVKIYEAVVQQLEGMRGQLAAQRLEGIGAELKACRGEWARAILFRARLAAADKRYSDAISIASEAQERDPAFTEEAGELVEYCRRKMQGEAFRTDTSLDKADPDYAANEIKIAKLLAEAQTFFEKQRFDEARNRLEQVFIIDPNNLDAIAMMERLYNQFYTYGQQRHIADVAGMMAYAKWQWAEPVFPADLDTTVVRAGEKTVVDTQDIYARMERIVFPTIEIDDADIMSVIRLLNKFSKIYDPDKIGVAISTGITADEVRAMGERGRVTINFSRIPMSEVLRYICQDTGLKYRVEANGVFIGPEVDEMQTQSFQVRGNLISGIASDPSLDSVGVGDGMGGMGMGGMPGGAPGGGGGGGALGGGGNTEGNRLGRTGEGADAKTFLEDVTSTVTAARLTEAKLKRYFELRGVKFKEGSGASISYDKRSSRLRVRNTLDNLRRMDELIRQLDAIETPLVMVEIKGVEISETDLQELGFDWSMAMLGSNMGSDGTREDSQKNGWAFGQGADRSLNIRANNANVNGAVVNNWNIFPALFGSRYPFGSDLPLNISLTVNALSRNEHAETLSAPKLMTSNGTRAEVKMVKAYYFPTDWETYEIEEDNGTVTITVPEPSFDDENEIGIIFDVTPRVNPDNYTISLEVNAEVTNYLGRDNYPIIVEGILTTMEYVDSYNPAGEWLGQTLQPVEHETRNEYNVWMPMISRRDLRVNVTVYDGETIVLGGMVDNSTTSRTDKWPILGDLPFIGRFFQAQSEEATRSNLLLFVTTRLVSNDGVPIRRNAAVGAPDFNR